MLCLSHLVFLKVLFKYFCESHRNHTVCVISNCSILDPHVVGQAKSNHEARSIKNESIVARFFIFNLVEQWHISIINMALYDPIAWASSKLYCYISFELKFHG